MSAAALTLLESATLVGRYRYVELACFEVLGRAAATGEQTFAPYLSASARAHAFRAELFAELLPVSVGLPSSAELTASPGSDVDAALAFLGGLEPPRLVAVTVSVLYPAMLDGWRHRLELASPFSDPPLARVLRRAIDDLDAVRTDGEPLVDSTLVGAAPTSALADPFGHTAAAAPA